MIFKQKTQVKKVRLWLEEAQAALTVVRTILEDRLDDDPRVEELLGKVATALDNAEADLTQNLIDAKEALDKI